MPPSSRPTGVASLEARVLPEQHAGRRERVQAEEAGRRDEGERDEEEARVAAAAGGDRQRVARARAAAALGVDGFLVVTPYYNRPPQRGIVAHVAAVAASTDRPVVFYDIPSRVVVEAEPETISLLAEIPNVRGVKQAKPSLDAARHVVACGLDLYAGDDDVVLPFLEVGGVGGICVHTHIVGPQVKEMITRYKAPRRGRPRPRRGAPARDRDPEGAQTNPIAIKRALQLLGHEVGGLRLPLVVAEKAETAHSATASSVSAC